MLLNVDNAIHGTFLCVVMLQSRSTIIECLSTIFIVSKVASFFLYIVTNAFASPQWAKVKCGALLVSWTKCSLIIANAVNLVLLRFVWNNVGK